MVRMSVRKRMICLAAIGAMVACSSAFAAVDNQSKQEKMTLQELWDLCMFVINGNGWDDVLPPYKCIAQELEKQELEKLKQTK